MFDQVAQVAGNRPRMFLAEGVFYYLSPDGLRKTLSGIRELQRPGDRLIFDYWPQHVTQTAVFQKQIPFFQKRFGFTEVQYTFQSQQEAETLPGYRLIKSIDMPTLEKRYTNTQLLADPNVHLLNPIVLLERVA